MTPKQIAGLEKEVSGAKIKLLKLLEQQLELDTIKVLDRVLLKQLRLYQWSEKYSNESDKTKK